MKLNPQELDEVRKDLDWVIEAHREVLNQEPRILKPLEEARNAAKTKYEDLHGENPSQS